jgi:DNA polymerase III subunit chi
MTEILFYHLQGRPLEQVLPTLLERTLSRDWTAVVEASSPERVAALDDYLWTWRDDAFLPHVTEAEPDAAQNPIVITASANNPNGANVRFMVDGARIPDIYETYERLVLVFDGDNPEALANAREDWKALKAKGAAATYWQQDETGRWEKKA